MKTQVISLRTGLEEGFQVRGIEVGICKEMVIQGMHSEPSIVFV